MTGLGDIDGVFRRGGMTMGIIKNAVKCKRCGHVVESTYQHDFKFCTCGAVGVDGGHSYIRRVGDPNQMEDRSEFDGEDQD